MNPARGTPPAGSGPRSGVRARLALLALFVLALAAPSLAVPGTEGTPGLAAPPPAPPGHGSVGSPAEGENPHGRPDRCGACHAPATDERSPGPALPVVQNCRACHPTADMHTVGVVPDKVQVVRGWPLEDGRVVCSTCHAEPAHDPSQRLEKHYWRGGPYHRTVDFCYSCHDQKEYTRKDPHHPRAAYDPADPTCAACHSAIPERGAPGADARLRSRLDDSCLVCHTREAHLGAASHLGRMAVAPGEPLDPALAVDESGVIGCWTCHEVHQGGTPARAQPGGSVADRLRERAVHEDWAGQIPADPRWPGAPRAGHPTMLALPASDGSLCAACHGNGP